ncbi:MAG: glycosyltransferase family 4 protein [Thermoflexales bacterium]|nr:glycosyltransferase family 4 protein [Thermoflexales bacterium]
MADITLDYTPAERQSAGIGRLTREVTRALLAARTRHRFRLFVMGQAPAGAGMSPANGLPAKTPLTRTRLTDRWLHRLWFRLRLPLPVEMLSGATDLYHATDFTLPPTRPRTRTVLTVHDLTFERDPGSAVPTLLAFLRRVVPASARRADHIVADSHATARDLTELYGIPPAKITTIHSGVDARFSPLPRGTREQESRALRERYQLGDDPYTLCVGTLQKRKNHLNLVRAFGRVLADWPAGERAPLLVISGGKGWLYEETLAEVAALGLGERVRFIGFADDADLPALYRHARAFAFPSLYEGFGLPVLEAMACGTPVVTSNVSSLPEVAGNAGLMVDPYDVPALAAAVTRALRDENWRAFAGEAGQRRAQTFTWRRAAEQLLEVYDRALGARPLEA